MKLNYRRGGNMEVDFSEVHIASTAGNYETLFNKPTINSIELVGALTAEELGLGSVYYDTTEHWNLDVNRVAEKGVIYVYSDVATFTDEQGNEFPVAGIKIGDGTSFLVDMPFVNDSSAALVLDHISNTAIHVTQEEKNLWNHKVSSFLASDDHENLVLSKDRFVEFGDIMVE